MASKSFSSIVKEYRKAGVKQIILATNYNEYEVSDINKSEVAFYVIKLRDLTAEVFYQLFSHNSHGDYDFRVISKGGNRKRKNTHIINKLQAFTVVSYKDLSQYEGSNFGYKCESFLFGACNYNHNDLIDGYYNGVASQLKSSIKHSIGGSYASSNKF